MSNYGRSSGSLMVVPAALALVLGGCAAQLRSIPVVEGAAVTQPGVVYALPKSVLTLNCEYALVEDREWYALADNQPDKTSKDDKPAMPLSTPVRKLIAVTAEVAKVTLADSSALYRIDPDSLRRFQVAVPEAKVTMSDQGLVTGLNVQLADKSAEMISSVLSTAFSVVKLAAVAGERPRVIERVELGRIRGQRVLDPTTPGVFTVDGNDLVYSDSAAAKIQAANSLQWSLDPPDVTVRIVGGAARLAKLQGGSAAGAADGLVVAVPAQFAVTVAVDSAPQQTQLFSFARAGGIAVLPIGSAAFESRTFAMTASATTGQVTEFGATNTSGGERFTKVLQDSMVEIAKARGDLLDAQVAIAQKEKALVDARKALEDAIKKASSTP